MSEAEFFDTTPRHFMRRRKAWLQNRHGMEEARFVSFYVLRAAGVKIRRFDQLVRFPWEKYVRRVKDLEAWDSPAMLKFDREADEALKVLNPQAYAEYMAGKARREAPPGPPGGGEMGTPPATPEVDAEMRIEGEIDF